MPKTTSSKSRKSGKCKPWCPPATIYAVLVVISTVLNLIALFKYDDIFNDGENKYVYFAVHLLVSGLWTWLLYWLCSNCH